MCHVYVEVRRKFSASESVHILDIRVSVWCVNNYFKGLFLSKVTFTVICLNNFVICMTYGLTCESYVFIFPYFWTYYSTGIHARSFVYVVQRLSELLRGKLCIWLHKCSQFVFIRVIRWVICMSRLQISLSKLSSSVCMFSDESESAVGRFNLPVTLSCIITSFYYNLLIYWYIQVFCHFINNYLTACWVSRVILECKKFLRLFCLYKYFFNAKNLDLRSRRV
jgi:hypothetical protein